jgi:hypothetical protein
MRIQVIGASCAACQHTEADEGPSWRGWALDATVERVDDLEQIMVRLFVPQGRLGRASDLGRLWQPEANRKGVARMM